MYMSGHVQANDFFNLEFSDPSEIVLNGPQDVLRPDLMYQAAGSAPLPDIAPSSDFNAFLNSAQDFFAAIADRPLIASAVAVVFIVLFGIFLSRSQRRGRPGIASGPLSMARLYQAAPLTLSVRTQGH
jgi:hypothetical protein